jgi:hypothetical protein
LVSSENEQQITLLLYEEILNLFKGTGERYQGCIMTLTNADVGSEGISRSACEHSRGTRHR